MTTRRNFIAASAIAAPSLLSFRSASAQGTKEPEFLFVQSAKGLTFDKATNKVTLTAISPSTIFFSDRPARIAGNMTTAAFIPFWSKGKDNFAANPPNADISILEGTQLRQVVVVLQDPVSMASMAVEKLVDHLSGKTVEKRISSGEWLATPENFEQPQIQQLLDPERVE